MNPKDKATQLFNKYYVSILEIDNDLSQEIIISILAKKHSLIAVTEIINSNPHSNLFNFYSDIHSTMQYWIEVKNEIEKL
jgi:hypothetical protein